MIKLIASFAFAAMCAGIIIAAGQAEAGSGQRSRDGCHNAAGTRYAHCHSEDGVKVERMNKKYKKNGDNSYRLTVKTGLVYHAGKAVKAAKPRTVYQPVIPKTLCRSARSYLKAELDKGWSLDWRTRANDLLYCLNANATGK